MATMLIVHEIDDLDHWLSSPMRAQLLGPLGYTVRTFVDAKDEHQVALILEGPQLGQDDLDKMLQSQDMVNGMKHDGVRPETMRMLVER
jgi:hypothetical protein